ncbi:uncharacterized protein LOC131675359 isoform X2 [Phymastichus coffea]|uniref:uncharacterized protein LOC131675359 isoform X2 n=1 Tax=Phymastichus coffea TaxID=108790 RepID=UPI00273B4D68|nr:uncharacterized protein LOC131675359 isoform X2 [Phymastichus coffea]
MSESRHLRSVSDLYAADEIEVLLLEEIRDLEPPLAAYSRPEDIQDFEIGSRAGGLISSQSSELDSPEIHSTVHSWDSHANYHGNYGHDDHRHGSSINTMAWPRTSNLIFYCDIQGHLKTATGLVRLLLLLSSAACLATLCSSGTAKVSLFMLPLVGRLRFMIFVAVFCLLITTLLLFLDISHVVYFFPFNWARVNAWVFTVVGIAYLTSSTLVLLAVFEYHGQGWVPRRTRSQLTATAGLGFSCVLLSFLLSWLNGRQGLSCHSLHGKRDPRQQLYKPVDSSSSGATLKDGVRSKQPSTWVVKKSKNFRSSDDSCNGNEGRPRKDHWASTRDHFLGLEEPMEDSRPQHKTKNASSGQEMERRKQRRRRETDAQDMSISQTKTSITTDESKIKSAQPPRKLPIQSDKLTRQLRGLTASGKEFSQQPKKPTRTSVTRSEIQEYWMQGYEHVQRTDKTTANIEQWQSAAMKSLEEKKAKDERWVQSWRQQKEQHENKPPKQLDDAKPCSSKTIEPLNFA